MHVPEWATVRAWISALAGLAAAAATAYLVWAQLYPKETERFWEITSIAVVAVVAIGSSFARPLRIYTIDRLERERHKVSIVLRGLPWTVHELTNGKVPVQPLGASAWVVTPWWPFQRLHRIAHERINEMPGPSGIRWSKGKGVIGHCWDQGREQIVDSGTFDKGHEDWTQDRWDRLDVKTRRGLSYKDYKKIRGKYGTVIAIPMFDRRERVRGVVVLDAPPGYHPLLKSPVVIEAVCAASGVVSKLLY